MARARVQHRHGTFSNYENNKTTILSDEIVVVDSGHPDTPDGSALYYRPSGASEPVRVANADELTEAGINVETVTESQLSNATGDNIYLCVINGRWHKVICVSGSSTRAQYAVSAYHNFIYRWQSKSGDSWGQWTDWSPIGIADNIRDGAITLSKLGTDVLEQLANKGVRVITPEESQGWGDEIPLTFAGDLYDIAGWNEYLWFLYDIPSSDTYRWVKLIDDDTLAAQMQLKENTANKAKAITEKNKNSTTLFPTVGATIQFIENNYYNKTSVDNKLIKVTYNQNGEGPSTSNTHFKRGDIWLDEAGDIWMVSWVSSNIISWKKVTRKVTGGMSDPPTTYFITAGTYPPYEQGDLYFKYGSSQNEVDAVFVLLNYSTSGTICYLKWIDLKSLVDLKNYYTKTEIDAKIAAITSLSFEVVQTKPTQNIKTNVIYLIPNGQSGTDNIYDEWIYVNNKWELIGSTAIDLSQYAKKSELPTKTSDLTNDSGFLTQHQDISGKENIANKVTSIDTSADDTHYPSALAVKNYVDTVIGGIENGSY